MDTKKDVNNEQIVEVKTEKTQIIQYDAKMNPGQNQAISSKEGGFEGSSKKTKKIEPMESPSSSDESESEEERRKELKKKSPKCPKN